MSETNGYNGNGNGRKTGQGRKDGATQLATLDKRESAIALFLEGLSVQEIAQRLGLSERSIWNYVRATRVQLIAEKRDVFTERIALYLEDTLDALATSARLLTDTEFLMTASPERIDSVSRAYGILSDKSFILVAGFGFGRPVAPRSEAVEAVSG